MNPEELPTTYAFEYGTSKAYGSTTAVTELPNPTGEQEASARISGLEECTLYHYRIVAENEASEGNEPGEIQPSRGEDGTFQTRCGPPTITLEDESAGENYFPYPNNFSSIYVNPNQQETKVTVESEPVFGREGLHIHETLFGGTPHYITTVTERVCNPRNLPDEPPVQNPVTIRATNESGTSTSVAPHEFIFCGVD